MKQLFVLIALTFSFTNLFPQQFEWVKKKLDHNCKYITDKNGNFYQYGSFTGTVDFDLGAGVQNLTSTSTITGYIAKYDSLGNYIWAKKLEGSYSWSSIYCYSSAVDSSGNVFLTGRFKYEADFDPGINTYTMTSHSDYDIFICKLDQNGNFNWAKQIGQSSASSSNKGSIILVDNFQNIFIGGVYQGSTDFNPGAGVFNLGMVAGYDGFVLKLENNGNFKWAQRLVTSNNDDFINAMVISNRGNIYTGGTTYISYPGLNNININKIDSLGNLVWSKTMGGPSNDDCTSIAVDLNENILSTGYFYGAADFDPNAATFNLNASNNYKDIYISKLDSSGNFVWAKRIGGNNDDDGCSLTTDLTGNIYVAGKFQDTMDVDPGPGIQNLITNGGADGFMSKFDKNGNLVWTSQIGNSGNDMILNVYVSSVRHIYMSGYFENTIDFDPGALQSNLTGPGAFLLKYNQNNICSNFSLVVDTVAKISCSNQGYSSVHVTNGLAPYSYDWSTSPIINSSSANFSNPGLYAVTASDGNLCTRTTSVLINSPNSISNFDLNSNIVASSFRSGFPADIWIDASNNGCLQTSGQLKLILDNKLIYNSSNPIPDIISGDTLVWNFNSLKYDSLHFTPHVSVTTSTTAVIGDSICLETIMTPLTGDINLLNNNKNYCYEVINAFDPNDKQVYPKGKCNEGYILNNQLLTYTVRFQNTGNASAININVLDSIDSDLDINSLNVIGSSHYAFTEILPGNIVKFHFPNINLSDSTSNELMSHGYLIFEITPKTGLTFGTKIENRVGIYFDFNPPVITNKVTNTITSIIPNSCVSIPTEINKITLSDIIVFPNPTEGRLTVQLSHVSPLVDIEVTNIVGQTFYRMQAANTDRIELNLNASPGIYFVKIKSENGKYFVSKIIKD